MRGSDTGAFFEGWQRVSIEITNRCNFDCLFCPSGIGERPKEDMPRELAFDILAQLNAMGFTGSLYLHVLGEPLLQPDVFTIRNRAADLGMRPIIFTNGGALSEDGVAEILSSKACELVISMQTINRRSYERLRSASFDWNASLGRIQTAQLNWKKPPLWTALIIGRSCGESIFRHRWPPWRH